MGYDTLSSGLTVRIPTSGTKNWAAVIKSDCFANISAHDHTGSGKGLQIGTNALVSGAVSLAKMADMATDRLLGRDTAGSGSPEEITVGGGVEFSGSGSIQRSALTGDVTASAGSNATTISNLAVSQAMLAQVLQDCLQLGWFELSETFTYASATTITVASDATTRFGVGDKLRLKQGGGYKYFFVVAVAATTLTVTGGDDYSVANSAITVPAVSRDATPLDFPAFFAYTPSATGFSVAPGATTCHFTVVGRRCFYHYRGTTGTSNSTAFTVSAPIPSHATGGTTNVLTQYADDNGAVLTAPSVAGIQQNSSTVTLNSTYAGGLWTAANGKRAAFFLTYPI